MGEIHELFVLALSLVWFAGATPYKGQQSPLPNISTLAILISPENPPKTPKWGPQNEFPGIPRIEGFCGNSTET